MQASFVQNVAVNKTRQSLLEVILIQQFFIRDFKQDRLPLSLMSAYLFVNKDVEIFRPMYVRSMLFDDKYNCDPSYFILYESCSYVSYLLGIVANCFHDEAKCE
jgi:hypothetical protein